MNSHFKTIATLVAAATAGIILGVLFAPGKNAVQTNGQGKKPADTLKDAFEKAKDVFSCKGTVEKAGRNS